MLPYCVDFQFRFRFSLDHSVDGWDRITVGFTTVPLPLRQRPGFGFGFVYCPVGSCYCGVVTVELRGSGRAKLYLYEQDRGEV